MQFQRIEKIQIINGNEENLNEKRATIAENIIFDFRIANDELLKCNGSAIK